MRHACLRQAGTVRFASFLGGKLGGIINWTKNA
jgi:hypothetical protein